MDIDINACGAEILTLNNRQLNHDHSTETYEVKAYLLADGRLYVPGAGVDGGDALFESLDKYEPCGTDEFLDHQETGEFITIGLLSLALADRDNVEWLDKTFLTANEIEPAVSLLTEFGEENAAQKLIAILEDNRSL